MKQTEIRVGEWLISPMVNQISRPGRLVTLEPRLIDLLIFFSQHPDVVLSRDELIEYVWTRSFVTPHVVTQSVSELRKSLKDNQPDSPEYIITVPKRGYKLVAAVTPGPPADGDEVLSLSRPSSPAEPADISGNSPSLCENPHGCDNPGSSAFRSPGTFICFLMAVSLCIVMVGLACHSNTSARSRVNLPRGIINPRYIDIKLRSANSCNQSGEQQAYASGLSDVISRLFNTYTAWTLRDKTSEVSAPDGYAGKTLSIEFVNQRHYRAQQCFMSVRLVDHASRTVMLEQRYFITRDNALIIQNDLISRLSVALRQSWPSPLNTLLRHYSPDNSQVLQQYYRARQLMIKGDIHSLDKSREILDDVIQQQPDFLVGQAMRVLVNALQNSEQPFEGKQSVEFTQELSRLENLTDIHSEAIYYQIMTIKALGEGHVDLAAKMVSQGLNKECSWVNLMLQGKVYEMKGDNQQAADSYVASFNLRPGIETLYWIENAVFQTRIDKVVPYLNELSPALNKSLKKPDDKI